MYILLEFYFKTIGLERFDFFLEIVGRAGHGTYPIGDARVERSPYFFAPSQGGDSSIDHEKYLCKRRVSVFSS